MKNKCFESVCRGYLLRPWFGGTARTACMCRFEVAHSRGCRGYFRILGI